MKNIDWLLIPKGFAMGAADVVPGVSGGTMAFITGIYERLLAAIASFDGKMLGDAVRFRLLSALRRPHWAFILPLVLGIALALFTFTRLLPLPVWLETHPALVFGFFFGLIAASAAVLVKRAGALGLRDLAVLLAGIALGLFVVTLVPTTTPSEWWFVMIAGALAITAMILPGISGSFILLILGQYAHVFGAIGRFDLTVLVPFGIGAVIGLALFSRLIGWVMQHFQRPAVMAITGFLIGSLWLIWPFRGPGDAPALPASWDAETALAIALILGGLVTVFVIDRLARR